MKLNLPAIIIGTVVTIVATKFFAVKKFLTKLKVEVKNVTFDKISFIEITYNVELAITNPTNLNVPVESIFIDIFFNNQLVGSAASTQTLIIKKQSKLVVPVHITTQIANLAAPLVESLIQAFQEKNLNILVAGKINFEAGTINFSFKKNIGHE